MPPVLPQLSETPTELSTDTYEPSAEAAPDLATLQAELAAAKSVIGKLRGDLHLRNTALDAGSSHFMIVETLAPGQPIVYVNRALARDHGYEPEQLIGKPVQVLMSEDTDRAQAKKFQDDIMAGTKVRTEMKAVRRDGSTFWIGVSTTPLRSERGDVSHTVTVGADITARIEAERRKQELQEQLYSEMRERERMAIELRLAQKLESVGRLAAGLAHEINTPIQYVGDSVYFLQSAFESIARLLEAYREAVAKGTAASLDPATLMALDSLQQEIDYEFLRTEVPKAFERTIEGTARVTGIVRAMKEFAHPDTSELTPADLNHGLRTTLTVAKSEYKYDASVDMRAGDIPQVNCRIGELNQVFLNLIVNAAHAIHDAGKNAETGRITVETRLAGNFVEVVIGDNGCGIAQENVEKIFDPFFTTKEVGRGTGQGLAIARSIVVDKHGGDIDVHSELGVGTRFTLRLPIAGRGDRAS